LKNKILKLSQPVSRDWLAFTMAFIFLAIILIGISIYSYNLKKSETLSHIDNKLRAAALSIKNILPKDFHDRAKSSGAIPAEEDWQNIKAISEFTNRVNCTFLYTLIQDDDDIYITSSSATKEELNQNVEVRYFTHFKEADENFYEIFDSDKAYSFTHKDRWGVFRAMAVPELSPGGKAYLAVAELEISHINKILKSNAIETILTAILVICGCLPVFYLFLNRVRQISEKQKKTEQQLQQAQKMESIGRLAGGVAHDYNNISSIIIGYVELALESIDNSDPMYDDLMEILLAAKQSADITHQLLAFARQQTVAPKVLDLNDTICNMLKILKRLIGEDIDLKWLPGEDVGLIKIDSSQIDQLLVNLCVNARDAIADVGKVTIETKTIRFNEDYCADHEDFIPGDYVLLAVTDDGCGMPPEIIDKIFEPFFTTKANGKGTGLGLATAFGIVKQNKGFINVYSEPEKGTTMKIYLPLHSGQTVQTRSEKTSEIQYGQGETILLVEDDASILKFGKKVLENLGYCVIAVTSADEAIKSVEKQRSGINLLITDVVMPEMNGRELSVLLQDLNPDLKILFMSGYTADVISQRGVLYDGVNFISKPLYKKDIAVKVREVLNRTKDSAHA